MSSISLRLITSSKERQLTIFSRFLIHTSSKVSPFFISLSYSSFSSPKLLNCSLVVLERYGIIAKNNLILSSSSIVSLKELDSRNLSLKILDTSISYFDRSFSNCTGLS